MRPGCTSINWPSGFTVATTSMTCIVSCNAAFPPCSPSRVRFSGNLSHRPLSPKFKTHIFRSEPSAFFCRDAPIRGSGPSSVSSLTTAASPGNGLKRPARSRPFTDNSVRGRKKSSNFSCWDRETPKSPITSESASEPSKNTSPRSCALTEPPGGCSCWR